MKPNQWAAAATLALCSSMVAAQQTPTIPLTLSPGPGGTASTSFTRSVTGLFVDTFSFVPESVSGPVTVTLTPGSTGGPVSFFSALLNGEGFSFFPEDGQSTFSFQALATSTIPLSLTVFGFSGNADTLAASGGTYSGTVTVVPEPTTYALMLLGLGVVAGLARHRKITAKSVGLT